MRCFVAVPLPEPVRGLLLRVQEALTRAEDEVKWVERENLHLSLKFLGEVTEEQVSRLTELLNAEAARWPKLRLSYGGIGAFPERGAPRIVWAGATGDLEKLAGLAVAIERAAEAVGVPREGRPFVAHVTLGRIRSLRNLKRFQALVDNQRRVPLGEAVVEKVVLYRSTLTPKGPIYEELVGFPLTADR